MAIMEFFGLDDLDVGETIKPFVVMVFFGLFGYAYCKREKENLKALSDAEDVDLNLTKSEMKTLTNLKKSLTKLEDKVKKIEASANSSTGLNQQASTSKPTYASVAASSAPPASNP
jgi:uncharacterized protein YlxW (UPF0749 family)